MGFCGTLHVPGDKSIAHRALMFAAMRDGETRITGLPRGEDVLSTMRVLAALGADIVWVASDACLVRGWGSAGPREPNVPLDCGNSGTTARLLMGLVAPWDIHVSLTGDRSLCTRPMGRVVEPLTQMGARFCLSEGTLPLEEYGTTHLQGIEYHSPVASAQVKSAILLAGLNARGETRVIESLPTRDHTERFIAWGFLAQRGSAKFSIPRDPSSAAFAIAAAILFPGSDIVLPDVCVNPTRIAFLDVLRQMGAHVMVDAAADEGVEPVGTVRVAYAPTLNAVETPAHASALLIDEFPVLALCAAFAEGTSVFRGIGELRVKESDRVRGIIDGLAAMGVRAFVESGATASEDLVVEGCPHLRGACGLVLPRSVVFESHGDHRLALTWQVVALCAEASRVQICGEQAAAVSYPHFYEELIRLRTSLRTS